jgi:uncharacterized alkaline shock family protein YloU
MIGNLASPNLAGRNEMSGHPNERRLPMGKIEVAPRAIATIAAHAVGRSYGVVGMAPHTLRAGVAQALRHEDAHKGVEVRIGNDEIAIDLYVILEYGTRIAEVARNIQENVRYAVERALGMPVARVNVRVQGLRMNDKR